MVRDTFTSGPWTADWLGCVRDTRNEPIETASPNGSPEGWANARLMAAAPDLLASLTDAAIQCAGRRRERFREHRCVDCSKWLDVIEKAVGP